MKNLEIIKTFTFALIHFSVAFTVTYLLTGEWLVASLVALIEPAVNTCAYFFHEVVWQKIICKKFPPVSVDSI